jgi:Uma2 family endonuclease
MALPNPVRRLSEAEYLTIERAADFKSEFFDGEMFGMSGGTRWHSLISANVNGELRHRLKGGKCLVFDSNMRVKIDATGLYTYPDVIVACEEQRFVDGEMDTLLNPTVVVEVLSDSTEGYDRGKKFENYRQIPSLKEYLLVSQAEPRIDQFIRQPNGEWLLHETAGLQNQLFLPTLGVTVPLSEIFANVIFIPIPIRSARPPNSNR